MEIDDPMGGASFSSGARSDPRRRSPYQPRHPQRRRNDFPPSNQGSRDHPSSLSSRFSSIAERRQPTTAARWQRGGRPTYFTDRAPRGRQPIRGGREAPRRPAPGRDRRRQPKPSAEALDRDLSNYMLRDKQAGQSVLDAELDSYMMVGSGAAMQTDIKMA